MKNSKDPSTGFDFRSLVLAAVPAYVFPTVMSFLSGYFLHNNSLMKASYSTIGLSSLLSTIISFLILWQLKRRQLLIRNNMLRTTLIIAVMTGMGALCALLLKLPREQFNITFSAFLGASIITVRQHINNKRNDKN